MKEVIGDSLLNFTIIILAAIWVLGWIILGLSLLIQKVVPKMDDKIESFLHLVMKPVGLIQKYVIIALVILFLIRLIASWLGWAPPFKTEREY